jgi:hypothetical protein
VNFSISNGEQCQHVLCALQASVHRVLRSLQCWQLIDAARSGYISCDSLPPLRSLDLGPRSLSPTIVYDELVVPRAAQSENLSAAIVRHVLNRAPNDVIQGLFAVSVMVDQHNEKSAMVEELMMELDVVSSKAVNVLIDGVVIFQYHYQNYYLRCSNGDNTYLEDSGKRFDRYLSTS